MSAAIWLKQSNITFNRHFASEVAHKPVNTRNKMTFFAFISFKSESLLSTTLPRCLAFVTQSTLFPLTWMALQLPLLAPNTIPVVFLSLNVTWNSFPYSSHIFTMYCRPCSEGDNNVISSAYDNAPTKCWETRHPYPLLANLAINSS